MKNKTACYQAKIRVCLMPAVSFALVFAFAGVSQAALIGGSFTEVTQDVNDDFDLTAMGTLDWAYWYEDGSYDSASGAPANSKAGGTAISDVTEAVVLTGMRGSAGGESAHDFTFTDGAVTASGTQTDAKGILNDVLNASAGVQLNVTLPSVSSYTVYLWVAAKDTAGTLTASIDGASDYTDSTLVGNDEQNPWKSGYYTLNVTPDSANDVLNLQYVSDSSGTGSNWWVDIAGVAVVPEPATMGLIGLGGFGILIFRRRMR